MADDRNPQHECGKYRRDGNEPSFGEQNLWSYPGQDPKSLKETYANVADIQDIPKGMIATQLPAANGMEFDPGILHGFFLEPVIPTDPTGTVGRIMLELFMHGKGRIHMSEGASPGETDDHASMIACEAENNQMICIILIQCG
jgi:hypothetical protein